MARVVDKGSKRLKILKDAASCFALAGYDATSMDDVAAAAGISKGSLYDYFKNKEDLFYGVFEWFQQQVLAASVERQVSETTARAQMIAFADADVAALVDNVGLYPVMLDVWAASAKTSTRGLFLRALQGLYIAYRAQVAQLIVDAQHNGEVKSQIDAVAVSAMMIGAVDGLLLQYWLDPTFNPRAWVKSFVGALFDGIASQA